MAIVPEKSGASRCSNTRGWTAGALAGSKSLGGRLDALQHQAVQKVQAIRLGRNGDAGRSVDLARAGSGPGPASRSSSAGGTRPGPRPPRGPSEEPSQSSSRAPSAGQLFLFWKLLQHVTNGSTDPLISLRIGFLSQDLRLRNAAPDDGIRGRSEHVDDQRALLDDTKALRGSGEGQEGFTTPSSRE